jgi:hypothetical protein
MKPARQTRARLADTKINKFYKKIKPIVQIFLIPPKMRESSIVAADEPDQKQSPFAKPHPPLLEDNSVQKRMNFSTIPIY